MPKKKPVQSKPINAVVMAVVFLLIGFVAGQYIEVKNIVLVQQEPVQEERVYLEGEIELPEANIDSSFSVEEAMQNRRSRRAYTEQAISLEDVSQILWALQGQTADWGGRTVPSAKGAYPLNVTVVAKNVEDLEAGVYHYQSETHTLKKVLDEVPEQFEEAAVQSQNKISPVAFILSGDYDKMTEAFDGKDVSENVVLEAGHAGQNAYLQVESLGLGTVVSGGFNQPLMQEILDIPAQEDLFYLIPVGAVDPDSETGH